MDQRCKFFVLTEPNFSGIPWAKGLGARVAVELSAEAAQSLVDTILTVLGRARTGGHLE